MSSDQEATHLSPTNIFAALRDVCALLYPEERDTRVVVADAELETSRIDFSSRAETNWHNIWLEAIRQNQVDALITVMVERYPTNLSLQAAIVSYHRFLAAGGRLDARALLTLTTTDDAPAPGDPPYQGMAYYDVADADRFFGREALTAALVDHLRHNNLLAVVGAPGSGKSSLVRAGVLPALQGKQPLRDGKQAPTGSVRWAYHLITPTAHPLKTLAASLTPANESILVQAQLMDALHVEPRSLDLYAHRLVRGDQRLLLLVDQFEELFTLCKDEGEQQAFVDNLLHAATDDGVVTLVLTLRADFYHHCARFPALRTALERQQKYIGAMTCDELRRAIEEPAKAGEWELQAGLVEQLLHDVGDEPGALPLLSHALLETWQRRRGRTLTLAGYRAAGGVQGAIAKTADDVFNRFTDEQKTICRILFLRLTELGKGVQDTHRRVRPAELKLTQAHPDAVQQVLKTLADARLVTTNKDEVQVAHEALIRHWATLRAWLDDDREGHRIQRRLTEAANQWVEFGKDPALLYRGVLLQQVQEWLKETIDPPNQIEMVFLQASQTDVEAEERRKAEMAAEREASRQRELENQRQRARIFRNAVVVAGLLLLLAAGAANYSYYLNGQLRQTITETQRLANIAFSRQLAAQSTSELDKGQYESAILLALAAGQITDTSEAFTAIRAAIANPGHSRLVFYGHTGAVTQATWNHDESKILTASYDGTARIWNAVTGMELLRFVGHTASITESTWSQDESKVLTRSEDGTVRIWDAATGQELVKIAVYKRSVFQAIWSQDERKILTSSADNTTRVWDAATGQELVKLAEVTQATWSQDERKILTNGTDGTARIWDAATGQELLRLVGHTTSVTQATWNQDESKILTSSTDGTARIWDAATGQELLKLTGHIDPMTQATWSQDENKILTSSIDGTARIWDAATGEELVKLAGHTDPVTSATWGRDESKVLTSSIDGTARIWDTAASQELVKLAGYTGPVTQATWSQDESKVLIVSSDSVGITHTVSIWDIATAQELIRLIGDMGSVLQATWSHDESKILTVNADRTVRIWNARTGQELVKLSGVNQATWSQDESKILTSSADGTARIWDAATGQEQIRLVGHTSSVFQATWSQDESKILTNGYDGTVRIWETNTGQELRKLAGNTGPVTQATWGQDENKILTVSGGSLGYNRAARVWNVATGQELVKFEAATQATWNQDESKILTSDVDGTIHIWDVVTGQELVKLTGHTSIVWQATWNQDESKILTTSSDDTARIWDATTGQELIRFEEHTGNVWQATWNQDESKILTSSNDGTVRIWYTQMRDLLIAGCQWTPRNFTWNEWRIYMQDVQGDYRPICPNALIPLDVIAKVQNEAHRQILAGQIVIAMQWLEKLNGWLQVNGQFKNYGVDVPAFVAEVSATATAAALPPTATPTPVAP
ncbi:MAG: effector-associated domain EAD1-containing protein [Caldilineaceae bacterium]